MGLMPKLFTKNKRESKEEDDGRTPYPSNRVRRHSALK